MSYSPQLRTAVLLSGTGTAGAYHAGALRALHEAGVKIDVMSGRGIGVVGAMFAAIDAAAKTWEQGGVWRRPSPIALYRWRRPLRGAALLALGAVAVLVLPLLVLATALLVYPLSFLVQMVSVDAGIRLTNAYVAMIGYAFSPGVLPTIVPRLITLLLAAAFCVLAAGAVRVRPKPPRVALKPDADGEGTRYAGAASGRDPGRWWARLIGSPWTTEPAMRHLRASLWQLSRGPAGAKEPRAAELSRRYAELLHENLGQPGFRELIVTTLDLDTRTDLVFAALAGARRAPFFQRGRGDLIDLGGIGRHQVLDALAGSLSLPVLTDPHAIAFSPESYWKGETHRTCDRPAAVARLFEELEAAGVEQVIVICADPDRAAPHRLNRTAASLVSRVADVIAAAESSAVRDAVRAHGARFRGVFVVQPAHNPIGPLDFGGTYDARSDRMQSVGELIDRGYEDAYRQFVEPVVGGTE